MAIDPVGPQKKIADGEHHQGFQKLVDGGGAKSSYQKGLPKKSGTRTTKFSTSWQGNSSPNPKHIYGKFND